MFMFFLLFFLYFYAHKKTLAFSQGECEQLEYNAETGKLR